MAFFLIWLSTAYSASCEQKRGFSIVNSTYPFVLDPLPYPYTFLQDVIPSRIVMLHHDTHQKGYLNNLNTFVQENTVYQNNFLSTLNKDAWKAEKLQKHAGGLYNHYLYWWVTTSLACSVPLPTGNLLDEIMGVWGTFAKFEAEFKFQCNSVFGSGWTWLCVNSTSQLEIVNTEYQKNPLMTTTDRCYPVLGIDLWEHSFYLKYGYDRGSYITDIWELIDWAMVEFFYDSFASNLVPVPF